MLRPAELELIPRPQLLRALRLPDAFARLVDSGLGRQAALVFGLKLATMAAGLAVVQITASLFSPETFLLLNSLLFLIAVHGCFNYSIQVATWREGGVDLASFSMVHVITLVLALIFAWTKGGSWTLVLSTLCYIAYRGNERILFNLQITRGEIPAAYGIILATLAIECAAALALHTLGGPRADRFILPSLAALALTIPITLKLLLRDRSDIFRRLLSDRRGMFLVSAHSGLIALNVMSDRLVFSTGISSIRDHLVDYLLIFSYCTAAYALTISLIEVRRPALFKLAPVSLGDFLRRGHFTTFAAVALGASMLSGAVIYVATSTFGGILGVAPRAPVLLFVTSLSVFFFGQAALSFLHTYYLSEKLHGALFGTWAVSGGVRIVGYLQSEWTAFLAITALSGFAAIGAAFVFDRRVAR
jgi:hypothetical protein